MAWQVSTMINLWSSESVSIKQLMGEESFDDMENDEEALLDEADRMAREREARVIHSESGWDDFKPETGES